MGAILERYRIGTPFKVPAASSSATRGYQPLSPRLPILTLGCGRKERTKWLCTVTRNFSLHLRAMNSISCLTLGRVVRGLASTGAKDAGMRLSTRMKSRFLRKTVTRTPTLTWQSSGA